MEDATLLEVLYIIIITGTVFVIFKKTFFMISICLTLMTILLIAIRKLTRYRVPVREKNVLVTGCDSKFGFELAKDLYSKGFQIFATFESTDGDNAKLLKKYGGKLHVLELDVTSDNSCSNSFHQVTELLDEEGLWGLVNCSNYTVAGDVELTTMEQYQRATEVNLLGTIRVIKTFLPMIRLSQGRIVNISSSCGSIGLPRVSANSASQYALSGFTESLRCEMIRFGVRVSLVESTSTYQVLTNKENIEETPDDMIRETSDEVLETYGEEYIKDVFNEISFKNKNTSQLDVNDAVTDALLNEHYTGKYTVGASQRIIDAVKFLTTIRPFIPLTWFTSLVLHFYGTAKDTAYEIKQYKKDEEEVEVKKEK